MSQSAAIAAGHTTGPVPAPLLALEDDATRELAALLDHATLEHAPPAS